MNFYQFIIARLNGNDIEKDFDYYLRLVRKGIAGFIIFGGRLKTVREGIKELQKEAQRPLIIASDLEQGLGQQLEGGTLFPPAMAIASAITPPHPPLSSDLKLLKDTFKAIAIEARYAGINTILAPVLDINTNPKNPIIATRAFGEDPETVSFFGCEMVKILQANGIITCGKHFPGHGDTEIDSHISLPLINKDLRSLKKTELMPFRNAINAGVKMIMLGHLSVPALEPSSIPVSLSERAVKYLRTRMGFKGIIITDALNMHSLQDVIARSPDKIGTTWQSNPKGHSERSEESHRDCFANARNDNIGLTEEKASLMALRAGVDLLLHPTDPERIVSYLEKINYRPKLRTKNLELRTKINTSHFSFPISYFEKHRGLSEELTKKAIKVSGVIKIKGKPFLVILNDEGNPPLPPFSKVGRGGFLGDVFAKRLKRRFPDLKLHIVKNTSMIHKLTLPDNASVIVAVFSSIKAWKGGPSPWLLKCIKTLEDRAKIFISFGSPYLLDGIRAEITKIYAYWDSDGAQRAVAELI